MLEFIDYSKSKKEFHSLTQQWITYYRCKCVCCKKCWFRPDTGNCACGGPFSGYQEESRE